MICVPPDYGYHCRGISGCVHLGLHRLGVSQDLYPLITDGECSAYCITLLYSWGPNWLSCAKPEWTGFVLGSSTRAGKRELSSKSGNSSRSAGCRVVREPTGCSNHSSKPLFCKELVGDQHSHGFTGKIPVHSLNPSMLMWMETSQISGMLHTWVIHLLFSWAVTLCLLVFMELYILPL